MQMPYGGPQPQGPGIGFGTQPSYNPNIGHGTAPGPNAGNIGAGAGPTPNAGGYYPNLNDNTPNPNAPYGSDGFMRPSRQL